MIKNIPKKFTREKLLDLIDKNFKGSYDLFILPKDGNKNRLREQDIYKIVTTYKQQDVSDPHYARFVPNEEIKKKNSYNLNISKRSVKEGLKDLLYGATPQLYDIGEMGECRFVQAACHGLPAVVRISR